MLLQLAEGIRSCDYKTYLDFICLRCHYRQSYVFNSSALIIFDFILIIGNFGTTSLIFHSRRIILTVLIRILLTRFFCIMIIILECTLTALLYKIDEILPGKQVKLALYHCNILVALVDESLAVDTRDGCQTGDLM